MRKIMLFTGANCAPCHKLKQVIMPIVAHKQLDYVEYDRDVDIEPVKKYNIMSVPTLLIFENDSLVARKDGYSPQPAWLSNLCDLIRGEND